MSRRIGIFWKYFISYSAIATIVILILAIIINSSVRERYKKTILEDLERQGIFAGIAFRDVFGNEPEKFESLVKEISEKTKARVTIIDVNGKVLADSDRPSDEMESHLDRPEVQKALTGEIGIRTRFSKTIGQRMSYVAVPVIDDQSIKGIVRLSLKSQFIEALLSEMTREMITLSVIIWGIILILTFIFSRIFSSSVKEMVYLTKRFASGDFTKRLLVKRQDELGDLSSGLNEMSRKLQSLFNQLQAQHDELGAIIESMTEGVLVLDRRLNIRLANTSFRTIFSVEGEVEGRSYIEVVRFAPLKEMVDELSESGQVKGKRMQFNNRILLSNGIALKGSEDNEGSYVLVFHDMTSEAHLEQIKGELVANASHELRTPLTAMRGYLETFEDEDPETQKMFIQVVRRNVDRISNMVSDLLLLSRLEVSEAQRDFEKVDIAEVSENVIKLIERIAQNKGLELKMEIEPGLVVNGDPFLLEQMMLNLLDNAVKYTEKGEVALHASQEDGKVKIQISDTGVGIPQRHLSRIFERFYRVDKARSRDLGGTGLGLSIVKHIIQIHEGSIDVESQPGIGTKFNIII
ncbi:HAMP domain-containing protein [Candidatus Poribacteria bacterium]|nr:HAMP domain-containing protein [Candidatus Poribacteria bacterium]